MNKILADKIYRSKNIISLSALTLFIIILSMKIFSDYQNTLIQKNSVSKNPTTSKSTDMPWKNSVCGNGACEQCEDIGDCCNYPCTVDQKKNQICPPPTCLGRCPTDCNTTSTGSWNIYKNNKYGYEFRYPDKLTLTVENDIPTLKHTIPYKNYGDCDMVGGNTLYERFTDFSMIFKVTLQKLSPDYNDGPYKKGILDGVVQYYGAEGCGPVYYYFPISKGRTLRVERNMVQAFTGISKYWNAEEILAVPGVITKEESDKLFDQILSSFKIY